MPKLFGTSGIRGIANREVTSELALKVGLALATYIENGSFLVARDTRVSGEMIENALTAGILAGGANANKLGIAPTPALAFLTKKHGLNAGVMITASHNPPEYNGIKIFNSDSTGLNEKQQEEIEKIIEHENFRLAEWNKIGKCVDVKYWIKDYIHQILGSLSFKKSWFVVIDPGCGATSAVAPFIFRELGCKVRALNAQPDGFFPGRSPLPDEENLEPLCRVVHQLKADIGIAYDGDGDRVVFIDENGCFVSLDRSLALYAEYIIEKERGGTIVTNVEASMCIEEAVEKVGGMVLRTRVGDVSIANYMKSCGAVFGGEPCGAWIHPKYHLCPDGILSSVLFLKMLEEKDAKLSELISRIPSYPILRRKVECPNHVKAIVMQKVEDNIVELFPNFKGKTTVDGVRYLVNSKAMTPLESRIATFEVMKEAIYTFPKDKFPSEVKEGMMIGIPLPNGQEVPAKVSKISDSDVTIDLNHPLAGKTLIFKVKLLEVLN